MKSEHYASKEYWVASVVILAYTWLYDWYVHGKLLVDKYHATAKLWRPDAQMHDMMNYCIGYHVITALLVTGGYLCWREHVTVGKVGSQNCPYRKSMGFGLWLGLVLGVAMAAGYIYMPITQDLALAWLGASVVKWTIAGVLLAKLHEWQTGK